MPTFRYEAMTSSGDEVVDVIEADDTQAARRWLSGQGLFVTRLTEATATAEPPTPDAGRQDRTRPTPARPVPASSRKPIPLLVSVFFAFAGVVCTMIGGYLCWETLNRISGAQRVEGKVVEIVRERFRDAEKERESILPIVEYQFADQSYRIRGRVNEGGLSVGRKLTVLVRPDLPAEGVIDSFEEKWMPTLIVGGVGIVFLLFTTIEFYCRPRSSG